MRSLSRDATEDTRDSPQSSMSRYANSHRRPVQHHILEQPANYLDWRNRRTYRLTIANRGPTALYKSTNSINPEICKPYRELGTHYRTQLWIFPFLGRYQFSFVGRTRLSWHSPFHLPQTVSFLRHRHLILRTVVCFLYIVSLFGFFCSVVVLWTYATNPCKTSVDNRPGNPNLVSTTKINQSFSDTIRCDSQPHCQAEKSHFQACCGSSATETEGLNRLVKILLLQTAHLQVVVICSPRFLHNNYLFLIRKNT